MCKIEMIGSQGLTEFAVHADPGTNLGVHYIAEEAIASALFRLGPIQCQVRVNEHALGVRRPGAPGQDYQS
jgi:hypothetical protein